jgi:hypothetical protein
MHGMRRTAGTVRLVSQLLTVVSSTARFTATCFWVSLKSSRFALRWSPRVFKISGYVKFLGFWAFSLISQRCHAGVKDDGIFANAAMTPRQIRRYCKIDSDSETLLESAMVRQGLSARAYDRILKVSRTIADLDNSESIKPVHVAEAVGYRSLDRTQWS